MLPFAPKRISFYSRWNGECVNATELYDRPSRTIVFGYFEPNSETDVSRAAVVIEEPACFELETRSMIWRIAEISVERHDGWIVFSRKQNDLSPDALSDFANDSRGFLEHLKDEHKRLNLTSI